MKRAAFTLLLLVMGTTHTTPRPRVLQRYELLIYKRIGEYMF